MKYSKMFAAARSPVRYAVALPSLGVQGKVVATIEELESETKLLESLCQKKPIAIDDLKNSLLHQAYSSQL